MRLESSGRNPGMPFEWPVRVYYEDTDAGGVVYYASYLRFMERARTEWLRSLGYEQDVLVRAHGIVFAVVEANVRYRRPARFNDQLVVTAAVSEVSKAALRFEQQVRRDGVVPHVCVEAEIRVACVDLESFRARPIPADILARIRQT